MKLRVLIISMIVLCSNACAATHECVELSSRSKQSLILSALKGGIAGASAYAGFSYLANRELPRFFANSGKYSIAAGLTALTWAFFQSCYTPEAYYNFVCEKVKAFEAEPLIQELFSTNRDVVSLLKDYYFKAKFPLYSGFQFLNRYYAILEECINSCNVVVHSYRADLHNAALEYAQVIAAWQQVLKESIKIIKEDPNYLNECNAQTMVEMQHAQAVAAHAAMIQATKPQTTYVFSR